LFWRKNFEDGNCPSPGLFAAQDLEFPELSLVSYENPIEKYLTFELRNGTKSQLYSHGKLNTLRCENKKFYKKTKFKKQTNGSIRCRNL
jgi:hypothetical protein